MRQTAQKKPAQKKTAQKKPAQKKPAQKKSAYKKRKRRKNKRKQDNRLTLLLLLLCCLLLYANRLPSQEDGISTGIYPAPVSFSLSDIPPYEGNPFVEINQNMPDFSDETRLETAFEIYSELDALGRPGTAYANICPALMPTEERGKIGSVKPPGWHSVRYDCVEGFYLYNRCHLIAYQLAGENANVKNLITGTRYLNTVGMLPFENKVADYVRSTGNHVLYRVTPIYEGENLLASGVQIEALSVEDEGKGVRFNVYCYNVQPGISIHYQTGDSELLSEAEMATDIDTAKISCFNIVNNSSVQKKERYTKFFRVPLLLFHKTSKTIFYRLIPIITDPSALQLLLQNPLISSRYLHRSHNERSL